MRHSDVTGWLNPARSGDRMALLCIAVLGGAAFLGSILLDLLLLPGDAALGFDFAAFYAAGMALRRGYNPYSWTQLRAVEYHLRSIGDPRHAMNFNSYANPPFFTVLMEPLTALSPHTAYVIWLLASVLALLAGLAVMARAYGMERRSVLLPFVLTPVSVICLFLGQQTPLLLLGLVLALYALRRGWYVAAGTALAVGWIKPHLILPLALVAIALVSWPVARRVLVGFSGATALLFLVSLLAGGGGALTSWGDDLLHYGRTMDSLQPNISSLAGLYLSVVRRSWSGWLAGGCLGAWVLLVALAVWRTHRQRLEPGDDAWLRVFATVLVAWLIFIPYTHPADLVLVVPALPLLLGRRLEGLSDPLVRLALGALLAAPEADLLGFRPNFVLSYSVLIPLTMLPALRPWTFLSKSVARERRLAPGEYVPTRVEKGAVS